MPEKTPTRRTREAMTRFWAWATPASITGTADHLRDRLASFLRTVAFFLACLQVLTLPLIWMTAGAKEQFYSDRLRQWITVGVLLAGATLLRRRRMGPRVMRGLDVGLTVGLAISQAIPILIDAERPAEVLMALVVVNLYLTFRAAIIPSSTRRTAAIGALAMVPCLLLIHLMQRPAMFELRGVRFAWFCDVLAVAFVLCTSIISRTIYGLSQRVSELRQLGPYTLVRRIGRGGMGEVFEATHRLLRRSTAVKLILPEFVDEATLTRFEREVTLTARLEHPNTVSIYDYGRADDGTFFYAMEMLKGLTLEELVNHVGPLPIPRVVHILQQVAGALAEAHAAGLTHRDIKPANIMLCVQGGVPDVVKVLDFGLVKDADNTDTGGLRAEGLVGTPTYMAPETIQAPHSADPRVDVYALASVGYLLMTGSTVFEAPSAVKMMVAQLEEMPVPPSLRVRDGVPAELEALVLRCLEKDPDKRPADGNELRVALLEARLELPAWTESDARRWWETEGAEVMRAVEEQSRESGEIGDIGEHATLRVSRVMGSGE